MVLVSNYNWLIILISFSIIFLLGLFFFIIVLIHNSYLKKHSVSIKNIIRVNEKYEFKKINCISFYESYDNVHYYKDLLPIDLLTYSLVKNKIFVEQNIDNATYNANLYPLYLYDVNEAKNFGAYDNDSKIVFKKILLMNEKKMFESLIYNPTRDYTIKVSITLTNINGRRLSNKYKKFDISEIKEVLDKLKNKSNGRYIDRDIWDSICKIERAKVTNRMRFAIYKRDGYRCCKCGRKTNDLEIDHIMPISKGGKTHPNNLQTLCKKCNQNKSNVIESGTILYNDKVNRRCPKCGAPLSKKNGKYGQFYGCINYPKCNYTEKV